MTVTCWHGAIERVFYWAMAGEAERRTRQQRPRLHSTGGSSAAHPMPRHVWVNVVGITGDQHPGVLLDWRRDPSGGWEALVVWAAGGGRHAAHARIDWLAAHHVQPRQ